MIFTIAKVKGMSMSPRFCHSDFVFALRRPFFKIAIGDWVLLNQKSYGSLLKEVTKISQDQITVEGYHNFSVDSRSFGSIPKKNIYAKVLFKISNFS